VHLLYVPAEAVESDVSAGSRCETCVAISPPAPTLTVRSRRLSRGR
jgi:hypothetical protein